MKEKCKKQSWEVLDKWRSRDAWNSNTEIWEIDYDGFQKCKSKSKEILDRDY